MFNNQMKIYEEPVKDAYEKQNDLFAEMSGWQSAFLCGLIKKYRPKKLLEIGVAAGGTTTIILNCLDKLCLKTEMHSVDIVKKYYKDSNLDTGYVASKYIEKYQPKVNHTFHLGHCSVNYIQEIGQDIDFLVLDSMHILPGELLDFLVWLPKLKNGAVVVLHDLQLHHSSTAHDKHIATNVLLSSVVGEKILEEETCTVSKFPNIGAFIINDDTRKYIQNVFIALNLKWGYMPRKEELELYKKEYTNHYDADCLRLYEMSVLMNCDSAISKIKNIANLSSTLKRDVFIYGCGKIAKIKKNVLDSSGVDIKGFCISNDQEKCDLYEGKEVRYITELVNHEVIIVIGVGNKYRGEVLEELETLLYDKEYVFDI